MDVSTTRFRLNSIFYSVPTVQHWEMRWRYCNRDLLWPFVREYDMLLILLPCHGTLRVDYHELRDFMVRSVTFLLFARYYGLSCVRDST
jgi:hypothetical protein